ncbi:TPA: hypothetical protein MYV51_000889 [Citrobacter amalonaticus]|nr:hypothetical protein AL524_11725 [Citrobacter amalonaticus]SUX65471.1 UDP-N-acetylglucosamine diphosphorylase/glucosamine-1-phosphate N-acetyltransferase [Citrobacter amalonaticus]BCU49231.1 hypothetical protein CIAM_27520 [Citrobacter amalonaticus]HCB1863987.1 hypothetical protein [Citrobacter amalonaticus]HCB1891311.1 hypothetical protein [Citrobacter amalonaticus]
MVLILSAAYIDLELQSEFGKLPPSMLPLGNKRLFQHQIRLFSDSEEKYITFPKSYGISELDKKWLENHDVDIIAVDDDFSLGKSLSFAIDYIKRKSKDEKLQVLFGDTIVSIKQVLDSSNFIAISKADDSYNWAIINKKDDNLEFSEEEIKFLDNNVVCGHFGFDNILLLQECLIESNYGFIEALNKYHSNDNLLVVEVEQWLDFGHINTYYKSKAKFTTQRAFNELEITSDWVEKSSHDAVKISAEANWFESVPQEIKRYTPQYFGKAVRNNNLSYKLEYLYFTALNELYVFADLPIIVWKCILDRCLEFIKNCSLYEPQQKESYSRLSELLVEKTNERLKVFCKEREFNLDDAWEFNGEYISVSDVLNVANKNIPQDIKVSLMHGDFCFSNILFDFRANRIKVIDPRGLTTNKELTIYGSMYYDLAKISHSILGMYDWIIAGYYDIDLTDYKINFILDENEKIKQLQKMFTDMVLSQFSISENNLYAMQIHLFLSMLPLHADDAKRQNALFANAFRLYKLIHEKAK